VAQGRLDDRRGLEAARKGPLPCIQPGDWAGGRPRSMALSIPRPVPASMPRCPDIGRSARSSQPGGECSIVAASLIPRSACRQPCYPYDRQARKSGS
jgi:hypothetical protein